jgi:para-aminobenzoate synthetase component 1
MLYYFCLMRAIIQFEITDLNSFKQKVIQWLKHYKTFCLLDSNPGCCSEQYAKNSKYDLLVGFDEIAHFKGSRTSQLKVFSRIHNDWLFGHFAYDVKNDIENLNTLHPNNLQFPDIYFFQPKYVISIINGKGQLQYLPQHSSKAEASEILKNILKIQVSNNEILKKTTFKSILNKEDYIKNVEKLKKRINRGDIYEANYCLEFFSQQFDYDPFELYTTLNKIAPAPFSAFYCVNNSFLACSSPERFLKKTENKIISQPIKGTAKRGNSVEQDKEIAEALMNNEKERTENVMITDLVRNDLSKSAIPGSVNVDELCHVYSFSHVHQMISTISATLPDNTNWVDIIRNTFPMGSMTGAPKINAMKLIDKLEVSRRGIYSGTLGYVSPQNDFDFNVIIRSLTYNQSNKYLSFHVGSAITALCNAEAEYDECLLKAKAMLQVFNNTKLTNSQTK